MFNVVLNKKNQELKKSCYCNIKDENFLLCTIYCSCLYKFENEKKKEYHQKMYCAIRNVSFAKQMHMFMPGQEYFVIGKQLKTEKRNAFLPCFKLLVILETQSIVVSYS